MKKNAVSFQKTKKMFTDTVNKTKRILRVNPNLVQKSGAQEYQIWLTTTIDKKRVKFYSGLRIAPVCWDKNNGRAYEDGQFSKIQKDENKKINKELKKIIGYCQEFVNLASASDLQSNTLPFDADTFKEFVTNKIRGKEVMIRKNAEAFIEDYIERKSKDVNKRTRRVLSAGTIYNHTNALNRLRQFCAEKRKNIVWELFDRRFEDLFTQWMNDKEYSANTIATQFSLMKVWLYEAEREGLIEDKSFYRYDTSNYEVSNVYLTENEIQRLYDIDFDDEAIKAQIDPKSEIETSRDLFVLACWTGFRFGDWHDLSDAQITDGTIGIVAHKTGNLVTIPLHPLAKEIIKKYKGKLPQSVCKDKTNNHIQKCAELIGLNQKITLFKRIGGKDIAVTKPKFEWIRNHTARRSFCTNMVKRGVPTRAIMAMSGHKTEACFNKYVKLSQQEYVDIVAESFKSL